MQTALPPVNWLRVFEVTARHLSVSSAARELHVTPSAVSQHIRLLEHRLKRQLFQRHARGLSLTAAGEALVPVCRESFDRLDMAVQEIFGHQSDDRLVVRVALGFARTWLMGSIAAFSDRHPHVQLRVLASVWSAESLAYDVQLDIRLASAAVRGMDGIQLTHDDIFPACSPRLVKRCRSLSHPAGLNDVRLLHTLGFQQGWAQWLAAAGVKRAVTRTDVEFDSMQLAMDMALEGYGVALARTSYAIDLLKSVRLVRLFDLSLKEWLNDRLAVSQESGR